MPKVVATASGIIDGILVRRYATDENLLGVVDMLSAVLSRFDCMRGISRVSGRV